MAETFIAAGIGAPDGTDVSGHWLPMRIGAQMLAAVYRSVLPLALKYGVTTEQRSASFFEEIQKSETDSPYLFWRLLGALGRRTGLTTELSKTNRPSCYVLGRRF